MQVVFLYCRIWDEFHNIQYRMRHKNIKYSKAYLIQTILGKDSLEEGYNPD